MNETLRSLRQYFGLVAALMIIPNLLGFSEAKGVPLALALTLVSLGLGVVFAFVAVRLPKLLPQQVGFVKAILLARFALAVVNFCVLALLAGLKGPELIQAGLGLAVSVALCLYLLRAVGRVAAEAAQSRG